MSHDVVFHESYTDPATRIMRDLDVVRCAGRGICRHRQVQFHPFVSALPCLHQHAELDEAIACVRAMAAAYSDKDRLWEVAGWEAALA